MHATKDHVRSMSSAIASHRSAPKISSNNQPHTDQKIPAPADVVDAGTNHLVGCCALGLLGVRTLVGVVPFLSAVEADDQFVIAVPQHRGFGGGCWLSGRSLWSGARIPDIGATGGMRWPVDGPRMVGGCWWWRDKTGPLGVPLMMLERDHLPILEVHLILLGLLDESLVHQPLEVSVVHDGSSPLLRVPELLLLDSDNFGRDVSHVEGDGELRPSHLVVLRLGLMVVVPPFCGGSLELVGGECHSLPVGAREEVQLLPDGPEPIAGIHGVLHA
ncbi:hypothetical protein GUJ93_ZPchr0003g18180 [Zizania palustris]|uniref:Uncharacterized protein n=1 Tax=Zizania palustris TaxID=103762 RepID=A0A8J5SDW2_ZIZPA|nr:hypothetical protein GUJ93_ZPchr0003g18180 [Zizania palustris]